MIDQQHRDTAWVGRRLSPVMLQCKTEPPEFFDPRVLLAKKEAAVEWCVNASDHAAINGGKPWRYVLIPHDETAENITLAGLAARFGA